MNTEIFIKNKFKDMGIKEEEIKEKISDLYLTSLEKVDLILTIQEKYDVSLELSELEDMTIESLQEYIDRRI